jgi:hypothetical protein
MEEIRKMRSLSGVRILGIVAVLMIFGAACKPTHPIIGRWEQIDGGEVLQFSQDGKMKDVIQGIVGEGTYELKGEDELHITVKGPMGASSTQIFHYQLDGDKLSLTLNGTRYEYQRIK